VNHIVQVIGPERAVSLFGVRLVGLSGENLTKLAMTVALIFFLWFLRGVVRFILTRMLEPRPTRTRFWTQQGISVIFVLVLLLGLVSIWFNTPGGLTSAASLVTAGLAVAAHRPITAIAGYLLILRGKNFDVGDRIMMGGVRGDVIGVGFMQTTIMEMGEPKAEQGDPPAMWVQGRQLYRPHCDPDQRQDFR
jgi:small-conductance mechanosensitive channel